VPVEGFWIFRLHRW